MSSKMPSQECCFDCQFIQQSTTAEEPLKHSYGHIIVESHPHIVNGECNSEMSFRLNEYKKGNGFPRPDLTTGASEHFDSGIGLGSKPGSPTDEEVSRWEQQKMQTPTSTKDVCPKSNEQANGKPKVKPPVKPKNKSRPLLSSGAPKSSRHDKPGTDTPGRNLDHEEPPIQAGLTFDELVQKDIKNFMSRIKSGWTFSNPRFVGQEIGAEGGHLEIKSGNGNYSVHLILPEGAVNQAQPIYMAVNWNTRGISPRVKLGPPGRKFNKCVYLKIPIYSDKDKDLAVIRREDENSEWMTNPGTAKCLHLGDDAMIETSSFSDYELKPQGQFCFRWLHVFVQQGTDGDGVSVRVYLTKDQDNEALTKREKGLNGVMRRKTNIPLDNQPLRLELRCDRGLKTLDFTNYRDISYSCLTHEDEYGTAYLLRFTGDKPCTFNLELKSGGFLLCDPIPIHIERTCDVSPVESALLDVDMVEHPFCQPLFSTKMVEELAVLLDDVPNKVWELAEKIKMPACTPIPKFRRERFGGSPTRCVLYFFQCLCKKNSYSKEISLRMLRQILENLELERASDKVKKYQWHQRKEPQEHTDKSFLYEQNHTSRVDTGAFPDSSTCDIAVSPHKTAFSVPSTFTDDTPKGGTSPPSTTDHLPSTTNTVITGLKFKDEEDIYDDASSYTANGATSSSTPGATGLQNEDEGIYEECYLHTDSRTGTANTASTAHLSTLSDGDNTSTMCPRDTKPKGRRTKDSGYGSKLFDEK